MLKRLIDYVMPLAPDRLVQLSLQDMAICAAWRASYGRSPSEQQQYDALVSQGEAWLQSHVAPDIDTQGRRHQVLLRLYLDMLEADRHNELSSDAIAFLHAALDLLEQSATPEMMDRVAELLLPHAAFIRSRFQQHGPKAGLPDLESHIQYATSDDILKAPKREARLLAGIEMPCRGPVMTCATNLRILGDVPENCTVVVEGEYTCGIDGYLLGRVLAKAHCEVRDNIAGVAVVLFGDIRARGIINNAYAISKMGAVFCKNAQGPRLIFGGKRIEIAESTMLGSFVTRVMKVSNDIRGGTIQVSELVQANYFRHLGPNELGIVLRRELSCEDFGEVTGAELNKLLSQAYRLRRTARHIESLVAIARNEIEHKAQSALMYILGGGETHRKLEEILVAQRRVNVLNRLISNLQTVLESAKDGMSGGLDKQGGGILEGGEFANLEKEDLEDQELASVNEEAEQLRMRFSSAGMDRSQMPMLVRETREKLDSLAEQRQSALTILSQKEREIQAVPQYDKLFAGGSKNRTKLELLQRILPVVRKQPPKSPMASRLSSGLVLLALGTVDRQSRNIEVYEERLEECRKNFATVSDRLGKDYQVSVLENPEEMGSAARATGRFEAGVKIYMDVYVEDDNDAEEGGIIITPEEKEIKTYIRANVGLWFNQEKEEGR